MLKLLPGQNQSQNLWLELHGRGPRRMQSLDFPFLNLSLQIKVKLRRGLFVGLQPSNWVMAEALRAMCRMIIRSSFLLHFLSPKIDRGAERKVVFLCTQQSKNAEGAPNLSGQLAKTSLYSCMFNMVTWIDLYSPIFLIYLNCSQYKHWRWPLSQRDGHNLLASLYCCLFICCHCK